MRKLILSLLIFLLSACSNTTEPYPDVAPVDEAGAQRTFGVGSDSDLNQSGQDSVEREPGILGQLQNLAGTSSAAEVTLALDSLVEVSREHYSQGLNVRSYAYDRRPVQNGTDTVEQTFQINSYYSSWIESLSLYEISRYENIEAASTNNTVMLTRINNQFNTEVLCSVSSQSPDALNLKFDRLTQSPSGIQGKYDENRYLEMLQNRQFQYVLKAIETYFPLGVTWTPDLFNFAMSKDEAGYVLTISIKDPSNYNVAMSGYGLDGKNIVKDLEVEGFSVENGQIKVFLDEQGVIQNIDSSIKSTVFMAGRSFEVSEKQQLYLSSANDKDKQALLETFEKINSGALGQGADFVLQISELESES